MINPVLVYVYVYRQRTLKEIHTFYLGGVTNYYRDATSLDSFRRVNARLVKNASLKGKPLEMFCVIRQDWEHQLELESNLRLSKNYHIKPREVLVQAHSSIWDFYKVIGYDFKTKRYNHGPSTNT